MSLGTSSREVEGMAIGAAKVVGGRTLFLIGAKVLRVLGSTLELGVSASAKFARTWQLGRICRR